MPVRKTESRIPANLQAPDLGQAVASADGRCSLVSFVTSPIVVNRESIYVVFVTDATLAAVAQSFEWTFTEDGGAPSTQTIQEGEASYLPQAAGSVHVAVRILGAGNSEEASLALDQDIVPLNGELESLIEDAQDEAGPGVTNPEIARELVNEHNPYYQAVAPQTPESGAGFKNFLFNFVFDGALQRGATRRKTHLGRLAASLNSGEEDFLTLTAEGAGVCGIRLPLLAMTFGNPAPLLPWTELPEPSTQRAVAEEQLRQTLAALDEPKRIDLFNVARFPKSNIAQCGHIIEALRDRYFSGTSFDDVLAGMSGTRAHWITRHFREGPLKKS